MNKVHVGTESYALQRVTAHTEDWNQFHDIMKVSLFGQAPDEPYDPHYHDISGWCSKYKSIRRVQLLLKFNGAGLGITTLDLWPDGQAVMRGVAISKRHQGMGHGLALGEHVATFAQSLSVQDLVVNANPGKVGFYRRLGFHEELWSEAELAIFKTGKATPPVPVQMLTTRRPILSTIPCIIWRC